MMIVQHAPSFIATFSRSAVRELDRAAAEEYAIPGIVLMENAAVAIEEVALRMLAEAGCPPGASESPAVLICCGHGNNGGDGLALARRLSNRGYRDVILVAAPREKYAGDALTNLRIASHMAIPMYDIDSVPPSGTLAGLLDHERTPCLIVDALFGTGLDRPIGPPMNAVVHWINALKTQGTRVLAVDIPSGLDCDTGAPLGDAVVHADATVTLAGLKLGFANPESRAFTGRVEVGDIGVPLALLRRFDGK